MKSKLRITIDIDNEYGSDLIELFQQAIGNKGILKVKDIFNPDNELIIESTSEVHGCSEHPMVISGRVHYPSEPEITFMNCIMMKRK